jgi:outer membrane protein
LRTSILILIALLGAVTLSFAQDLKIGYVQVELLIQNFPEHEDAAKTYEKEVESWQTQLNQYQTDLAALEEDYKQKSMLYSPEKQREKQDEILKKRQEAVKFYQDIFGPEGKAEARKLELLSPIYEKVNRAIEILGERDKYTMIFNAQGLLYAKTDLDITDEVLKILKSGVDLSPSSGSRSTTGTTPRR